MKEAPTPAAVVQPSLGTRRYRRNCRLRLNDGALEVTNRKRRSARFVMDGSDRAPKEVLDSLDHHCLVVVDGLGRGLVVLPDLNWDSAELGDLFEAAGLPMRFVGVALRSRDEPKDPLPPMRPDGVKLTEPSWAEILMASTVVVLGAVGLARIGVIPVWSVLLVGAGMIVTFLAAKVMGVFAPERKSKSWPDIRRIQLEAALDIDPEDDARHWSKTKRLNLGVVLFSGVFVGGGVCVQMPDEGAEVGVFSGLFFMALIGIPLWLWLWLGRRRELRGRREAAAELDGLYAANPDWKRLRRRRRRRV